MKPHDVNRLRPSDVFRNVFPPTFHTHAHTPPFGCVRDGVSYPSSHLGATFDGLKKPALHLLQRFHITK